MTHAVSKNGASALWISLLTAASTATTLVFACATPFPSLAALAATHMRPRDGIALMLMAWLASQFIGFFLLDYPHDARTLGWIPGLGTAAVASVLGAYASLRWLGERPMAVKLAVSYAAGFAAFKAVVLCWALFLGGVDSTIDPSIVMRQVLRNGAILIGLYLLYRALVALGIPAAPRIASAT